MNNPVGKYLGTLLESRTQSHIFHLQTTNYAQHKALQKYYEDIVDLIDTYAEGYQGMYGRIVGYEMKTPTIEDPAKIIIYFNSLCSFTSQISQHLPQDSYLRNTEDEIKQLINKTKYLLTLS